ncbi:MAG: UpxY family transcription antiterminator [Terriglobales bacterium]
MTTQNAKIESGNGGQADRGEAWYAACTRSRHEKMVAEQLRGRGVEHFLPLGHTVRRWRSRMAEVDLPLFPGYVFVHIPLPERLRVLTAPGVAYLVASAGRPLEVPEQQMEALRERLAAGALAEPHPYLAVGSRVRVWRGPLAGLEGVLLRKHGQSRLIVSVDMIQRSIALHVEVCDVEPLRAQAPALALAGAR